MIVVLVVFMMFSARFVFVCGCVVVCLVADCVWCGLLCTVCGVFGLLCFVLCCCCCVVYVVVWRVCCLLFCLVCVRLLCGVLVCC